MLSESAFLEQLDALRVSTMYVVSAVQQMDHILLEGDLDLDLHRLRQASQQLESKVLLTSCPLLSLRHIPANENELSRLQHDLRGLIHAVKGYAEIILEEFNGQHKGEITNLLSNVVETTIRITPMIDRLRSISPPPLIDDQQESAPGSHPAEDSRFDGRKVLVIDDNETNRTLIERRLRRAGLEVYLAASGQEGLSIVRTLIIDLVLCDMVMPGFDGYEVIRALKTDPQTREVPILMISAVREDENIARCIEAGADDYVTVPFDRAVLQARIYACLNRRLLREQNQQQLSELEETRAELFAAIESMSEGFAIWGSDKKLRVCNQRFRYLYPSITIDENTTLEQWATDSVCNGIFLSEETSQPSSSYETILSELLNHLHKAQTYALRMRDGAWIEISCHNSNNDALVTVHKDVTERKRDEERLTWLAMHDPLTGLANRALFEQRLSEVCSSGRAFALLYIDLDGFKQVNDTLGHDAGDHLLIHIGNALRESVRTADLVARIGGDEFGVVLGHTIEREDIIRIADRIIKSVGSEYEVNARAVNYSASIGIAIYHGDNAIQVSPENIIVQADMAMYAAKKAGKARWYVHGDRLSFI